MYRYMYIMDLYMSTCLTEDIAGAHKIDEVIKWGRTG